MTTQKEKNIIIKKVKDYDNYYAHSDGYIFTEDRVITQKDGSTRTIKGRIMKSRPNNMGYHSIDLYQDGVKTTHLLHRILLKSLDPTDDDTLQVNHIDRDKSNNKLENLEWTTASENVQHYVKSIDKEKRTNKNIKVTVGPRPVAKIDKNTNEILDVYESIAEAARQVKCNETTIRDAITHRRGAKTAKGFAWQYISDLQDKIKPTKLDVIEKINNFNKKPSVTKLLKPVARLDKDTKEILETYESIAKAAQKMNCYRGSIRDAITHRRGIKTAKGFAWKYIDKLEEKEEVKDKSLSDRRKAVAKIDKDTNEVLDVYESIAEAARQVGCTPSTIRRVLPTDENTRTAKGFIWKYLNDLEKIVEPNKLKEIRSSIENSKSSLTKTNSKPVVKIDKDTNEVLETYESIAEAARQVGCHPRCIQDAITNRKNTKTAKGFVWKYKENM